ncbi:hypothetical protein OSB04_016358 [Centaurea solstitialis]|uniref:CCHC-type domain-containing protein n=1 Tax=Centaurea solstitialis TaxID=347529 RepID=A0AA38T0U2_9ASTR|nr:hypothetical protein OSB04_016358 [Centaurea solstitialis]
MDYGKSNYNGGDSRGNSSRQVQRDDQQTQADQGIQRSNHPQGPITQNPAPQQTASPTTTCYKCGKLGHYARDCSVKYKDVAYFERKASLMRKKEKGVALLVDEENWVCEEESSDEEDHLVKGLCLMADFEESEAVGPSTYQDIDPSEVSSLPDITDTVAMLESKICELERCLQSERTLVTKFRIDSAIYKDSLEDLTIVYNRETLESGIRESNLANKLSCLQKAHEELNSNHGELNIKFQLLSEERTRLFSKIQELEDNNFKREQSEQTLSILTQHAKKKSFLQAKPGLGLSENHVLDKAPSHLYNFEDMAASKPKPAIVGGHVTEEFVRQTVTYTEVINGETITRTISPTNSTSSSPPTSPPPNRPIFVPASDPTNSEPTWEGIKARTPRVAMPPINYIDLNSSYDTREMELSEETLVIPPEDTSATKCPDLVRLEKEKPKDSGFELIAYTDSDHAGCKLNRKSTSGACQFLGDKLVSWSSRKQNAGGEYVAAACCCSQVLWMKTQLVDFGYTMQRIPIYCDSKSAIQITANPVQHSRTKHIDIRYHFIKDHVEKGNVELYFVESDYQLADLFTKPFDEKRHFFLLSKLGMLDLPA